jgi:UDP-2,4-diacetamido-2,4,6-trideoxy-beta-L-altropyranose hydrolase
MRLRPACEQDSRLLFEWASDPQARAASFHETPPAWVHHVHWLDEHLHDPTCLLQIIESDPGLPLGQLRLDLHAGRATISISLAAAHRGRGLGSQAIRLAVDELLRSRPITGIDAYVKPDNTASIRAFRRAGFREAGPTQVRGHAALRFEFLASNPATPLCAGQTAAPAWVRSSIPRPASRGNGRDLTRESP